MVLHSYAGYVVSLFLPHYYYFFLFFFLCILLFCLYSFVCLINLAFKRTRLYRKFAHKETNFFVPSTIISFTSKWTITKTVCYKSPFLVPLSSVRWLSTVSLFLSFFLSCISFFLLFCLSNLSFFLSFQSLVRFVFCSVSLALQHLFRFFIILNILRNSFNFFPVLLIVTEYCFLRAMFDFVLLSSFYQK